MKALIKEAGRVRLADIPDPIAKSDEVVIRVLVAGICRTDLNVAAGTIASADPITLGHELCGRLANGTLVAVDPRIDGFLGVTRHGAFAQHVVVPASHVLALPEIDPRACAYVEPIAAALAVPAVLERGMRVGVLGDNRFAELLVDVLGAEGFEVSRDGQLDAAVETTGTASEIAMLCDALRPGGMLVLKSRTPAAVPLDLVVEKQLIVRGVQYGSFARAVELASVLPLDRLFGESWPLEQWETAFARARASEARKVFLEPCAG